MTGAMTEAERRRENGEVSVALTPQARMRFRRPDVRRLFEQAFILWVRPRPTSTGMVMLTFIGLNHQFELELSVDAINALHRLVHPEGA